MLYRPLWLLTLTIGVVLVLMLGLLLYSSWRNAEQLEPVRDHLQYLAVFESTGEQVNELHAQALASSRQPDPTQLSAALENVRYLRRRGGLAEDTGGWLTEAERSLSNLGDEPTRGLEQARAALHQAHFDELMAQEEVVRRSARLSEADTRTAMGLAILLILATLPLLVLLRNRVLFPLHNLGYLMRLLARQDFSSAPTASVDPMLRPLFENYNHMVNRLMELETEHSTRERSLRDEVRAATRLLLQQQRRLARSERLAAVGEVSASVAHELRNPLAGAQMALTNLRRDLSDPDAVERIDLVLGELKRITQQLNDLLRQAAQDPEPAVVLPLRETVEQLLGLLSHQLGDRLQLKNEVPEDLRCRLPEGALRQALVNLVQNAAQVIGDGEGTVTVGAEQENGRISIQVCDNGPGFPDELLESGVRPFASFRPGGTGLGLATVRRFARDLGGDIELSNPAAGGACVNLNLPAKD